MKKLILILILIISLSISAFALQQTAGELKFNLSAGETAIQKYGIRNEENTSIVVKFNVTGNASEYIWYEKELTLNPNEFRYVNVTTNIPGDYSGNNTLRGTIYVLKEGEKGGQVQINVRLGKNININVAERPKPTPKADGMSAFMLISVLSILVYTMKNRIRK